MNLLQHLTNDELYFLFIHSIPEQIPPNFNISPLPEEINSFIISWLQKMQPKTQQIETHKISSIAAGMLGVTSLENTDSTTRFSMNSRSITDPKSSLPSAMLSEKEFFLKMRNQTSNRKQSTDTWKTYVRPSEVINDKTQAETNSMSLSRFYETSSKDMQNQIP